MNTISQEFRELHEKPKIYCVQVGSSSNDDSRYTFGPFDEDEADECAYQIERTLNEQAMHGQSDRPIEVTTLYRGLDSWYDEKDWDEQVVHIEP